MAKVIYEKRGKIAYVTLNRPEVMNAIDLEMHELLWETWKDFRDDDALELAIVTGAGDEAFSTGADLKTHAPYWLKQSDGLFPRKKIQDGFGGITRGLHRIYKPIIAAVNGWALAGGRGAWLRRPTHAGEDHSFGERVQCSGMSNFANPEDGP